MVNVMKKYSPQILPVALAALLTLLVVTQFLHAKKRPDTLSTLQKELNPQLYKGPQELSTDTLWHDDILTSYSVRQINLGKSFDGPVCCTLVRRRSAEPTRKAVLYVHGFNDYFFQAEMGKLFNDSVYNFYAVDLRRYGRSLRPWQYPFDVRNMDEYFADIDSALSIIRSEGNTDITLSGHSTGGLTVLLYAAERGAKVKINRVVTDSPFLEWNFNAFYRKVLIPAVTLWGAIFPSTKINQGDCNAYAESLLKEFHGEWTYNTDWKMIYSPPVKAGWIRAISRAQSRLMKHANRIAVPVLVMHSNQGLHACNWDSACMRADIVLNPKDLQTRGVKMGLNPEVVAIQNGIHDLILSSPPVRAAAYHTIFKFIRTH